MGKIRPRKAASRNASAFAPVSAKRSHQHDRFGNAITAIKVTIDSHGKATLPHGVQVKDAGHWWFDDKRRWLLFQIRKTHQSGERATNHSDKRPSRGKIDLRKALAEIGLNPKSVEGSRPARIAEEKNILMIDIRPKRASKARVPPPTWKKLSWL